MRSHQIPNQLNISTYNGILCQSIHANGFLQSEFFESLRHLQKEQQGSWANLHLQRCADAHFKHWHVTVNASGIGFLPFWGIKRSSTSSNPNEVGSTFSSCIISPCFIWLVAYRALKICIFNSWLVGGRSEVFEWW